MILKYILYLFLNFYNDDTSKNISWFTDKIIIISVQKNWCKYTVHHIQKHDIAICQEVSPSTKCFTGCTETVSAERMVRNI